MSRSSVDPAPIPNVHPTHILLVEDEITQRLMLADWLRTQNYIIHEAATADEATLLLASQLPIELVIADIWLPGLMDGSDLTEYIRYAFPDMPVIVTSGIYNNYKVDALTVFFQKPYKFEDISLQISKMLRGKKKE